MKNIAALLILMFLPFQIPAQEQPPGQEQEKLEAVPAPPDIPDPVQSGQPLEPDVTIIQKEDGVIEEYRINGILYMVKVTPNVGQPYYLIDRDGDGSMETRRKGLEDPAVPQWILFSW